MNVMDDGKVWRANCDLFQYFCTGMSWIEQNIRFGDTQNYGDTDFRRMSRIECAWSGICRRSIFIVTSKCNKLSPVSRPTVIRHVCETQTRHSMDAHSNDSGGDARADFVYGVVFGFALLPIWHIVRCDPKSMFHRHTNIPRIQIGFMIMFIFRRGNVLRYFFIVHQIQF